MRDGITMVATLCAAFAGACVFDGDGLPDDGQAATPPELQPPPGAEADRVCYFGTDPSTPAATVEHTLDVIDGVAVVHVRLTLDPRFADNTYGVNAIGWGGKGHTFKDLVGSDHAQFELLDAAGALVAELELDYLSASAAAPSGFASLGVSGGDGKMLQGDKSLIVASDSSLARNLNQLGLAGFTTDSPATNDAYQPNPAAPGWDYLVVYEMDVRADGFGAAGFGEATIASIHASPSKLGGHTVPVEPRPCPPGWSGFCDGSDGCEEAPGEGMVIE